MTTSGSPDSGSTLLHRRSLQISARLRSADSVEALHVVLTSDAWRACSDPVRAETPQGKDLTSGAKWPTITASC